MNFLVGNKLLLLLAICSFGRSSTTYVNSSSEKDLDLLRERYNELEKVQLSKDVQTGLLFFAIVTLPASFLCNSLIIHTVRTHPRMRSGTTNKFIVNMAVGDILATMATSTHLIKYIFVGERWFPGLAGTITCKLQYWGLLAGTFCSVFSLVLLTVDRYGAVKHPLKYKLCSKWVRYAIPCIWIISSLLPIKMIWSSIITITFPPSIANQTFCVHDFTKREDQMWALLIVLLGFVAPLVVMKMCYACMALILWRRKIPGEQRDRAHAHKTAKTVTSMVVCILLAFEVCWAPFFIFSYIVIAFPHARENIHAAGFVICFMLVQLNGPMNVVMYAVFNDNFRKGFQKSLKCAITHGKVDREKSSQPTSQETRKSHGTSTSAIERVNRDCTTKL